MKTHTKINVQSERQDSAEAVCWCATLRALTQWTCALNRLALREGRLTVTSPSRQRRALDFAGRVPFGFAFTEGHQTTFNVPSGHRFVIEHLNISCSAANPHLLVQLVTKSPYMFRNLTLCNSPGELNRGEVSSPIQIQGFTTNMFLFSNGELRNSSRVPPDTYLQVWGYLEPTSFPDVS